MTASEKPLECPRCHKQGTVEELMGHTCKEKPWTPDMPLRADAAGFDIVRRGRWLYGDLGGYESTHIANAARELASAVSEEKDAKYREDTSALTAALREALRVVAEKDAEIAKRDTAITRYRRDVMELVNECGAKDAEIARLRKGGEHTELRAWEARDAKSGRTLGIFAIDGGASNAVLANARTQCSPTATFHPLYATPSGIDAAKETK